MEGFWPIFFLAVILKIPVAGLLYLVWWAVHQTPEIEEAPPSARDDALGQRVVCESADEGRDVRERGFAPFALGHGRRSRSR